MVNASTIAALAWRKRHSRKATPRTDGFVVVGQERQREPGEGFVVVGQERQPHAAPKCSNQADRR